MEKDNINRRSFLKKSAKAVAVGTLALSALDVKKLLALPNKEEEEYREAKVISLSDYPDLQRVGGYTMITDLVIVIRVKKSKFVALNITCTHKKCDVDYDGKSFECPCHGSTYTKYGKVTEGPAKKNLKKYKTTYNSEDDTLTIKM